MSAVSKARSAENMTILQVGKEDSRQLQNIANILASSKKIVVVTGAGISTNCGIPVSYKRLPSAVIFLKPSLA